MIDGPPTENRAAPPARANARTLSGRKRNARVRRAPRRREKSDETQGSSRIFPATAAQGCGLRCRNQHRRRFSGACRASVHGCANWRNAMVKNQHLLGLWCAENDALEQGTRDVESPRGNKPTKSHLGQELLKSVGDQPVRNGEDRAQAERYENFRARAAVCRFRVLGIEHDVCGA